MLIELVAMLVISGCKQTHFVCMIVCVLLIWLLSCQSASCFHNCVWVKYLNRLKNGVVDGQLVLHSACPLTYGAQNIRRSRMFW